MKSYEPLDLASLKDIASELRSAVDLPRRAKIRLIGAPLRRPFTDRSRRRHKASPYVFERFHYVEGTKG